MLKRWWEESILLNLVKRGSFVLRTKKVTPDFTKIQLYHVINILIGEIT